MVLTPAHLCFISDKIVQSWEALRAFNSTLMWGLHKRFSWLNIIRACSLSLWSLKKSFCFYKIKLSFSKKLISSSCWLGVIPGPCQLLQCPRNYQGKHCLTRPNKRGKDYSNRKQQRQSSLSAGKYSLFLLDGIYILAQPVNHKPLLCATLAIH